MTVLVVSPHFPPSNTADMHRVRLLLPHFQGLGVRVEVLAVEPGQVAAPWEEWLVEGLPADVPVHRVRGLGLAWSRIPGLGVLEWRALGALRRAGDALLGSGRFDLVYFSTTVFGVHVLGPRWERRFGIPFVMDYQDPWVTDYYRNRPGIVPPGGRFKYAIADGLSRRREPAVLKRCSGITSVSEEYPKEIVRRYPGMRTWEPPCGDPEGDPGDARHEGEAEVCLPALVVPFPACEDDWGRLAQEGVRQGFVTPGDGQTHLVYVGRGGPDMATSAAGILMGIARIPAERGVESPPVVVHFIGTSYAPSGEGSKTLEPVASRLALPFAVKEHTDRVPMSTALRCLLDADGLIVPGSDDPGYTASKIYPYLLAGKPMLAVFHERSSVVDLIRRVGGATVIPFGDGDTADSIAARVVREAFDEDGRLKRVPLDREAFQPYMAAVQAERLVSFFRHCLAQYRACGVGR